MTKQDIIDYVMNTPHNTNKAVLSSMLNQLTNGGGGGDSDFSTASVTITANDNYILNNCSICVEENELGEGAPAMIYPRFEIYESGTFKAPLYKGGCFWMISPNYSVSISGNIENLGTGVYLITGDCTITIS